VVSGSGAKVDAILVWALALALAWAPLPFGSTIAAAWGVNAILFGGLALAFEVAVLMARRPHPVGLAYLALPAALFAAVLVWILVQASPWTPAAWHHPVWGLTADILGRSVSGTISVNRDLTWLALVRLVTAAAAFWLALELAHDARRATFLVAAIGVVISGYATFGIAAAILAPGKILWLDSPVERGFVTSTFMNRNTFGTYAGLGFLISAGFLIEHYRAAVGTVRAPIGYRIVSLVEATDAKVVILLGATVLNFGALALTGSRGAMIATVAAFAVLGGIAFSRSGWRSLAIGAALVLAVLAVLGVTLGGPIAHSLAERGFYDANRMSVYALVARSIADAPILGYGYGTFPDLFPMLRDRSVAGFDRWEMAHNIYLELLQELGVVFGGALILCIAWLALRCCVGAVTRRRDAIIPSIAASASVLVGLHAAVDYSLQTQAIALSFFAVLGAGVAQSASSRRAIGD
jgi:O-antigen ligase